jgi:hypothetical protein
VSVSAEGLPLPAGAAAGLPNSFETRLLAGFLQPDEAVQILLGGNPQAAQNVPELTLAVEARRGVVANRPAFEAVNPVASTGRTSLDAVAMRPEVQATFNGRHWTVEWVDMRQVVAVQKEIITTGLEDRVLAAPEDEAALLELCLPTAPETAQISFNLDPDRHGITLVSPNPNLRLTGLGRQQGAIVIGFGVPAGYVNVAHCKGRYYLCNGYHRVAGLMRAGVSIVPAIVTEAVSYGSMALGDGIFAEEITAWSAPPLIGDFWDESVALDSFRPVHRSGFHIRADEIRLPG